PAPTTTRCRPFSARGEPGPLGSPSSGPSAWARRAWSSRGRRRAGASCCAPAPSPWPPAFSVWSTAARPGSDAGARGLLPPEHHLGAAEDGDDLAGGFVLRLRVPDLGHAAAVDHAGLAAHDLADPGGAQEVGLQLHGGEAARALRQRADAA